mmetsp:Transcript_79654/g.221645  ORF Transcript_79654/g.221645 Transcript_79654/m.221645 type:complete len:239 (-) Transcript_79654:23-739(-)
MLQAEPLYLPAVNLALPRKLYEGLLTLRAAHVEFLAEFADESGPFLIFLLARTSRGLLGARLELLDLSLKAPYSGRLVRDSLQLGFKVAHLFAQSLHLRLSLVEPRLQAGHRRSLVGGGLNRSGGKPVDLRLHGRGVGRLAEAPQKCLEGGLCELGAFREPVNLELVSLQQVWSACQSFGIMETLECFGLLRQLLLGRDAVALLFLNLMPHGFELRRRSAESQQRAQGSTTQGHHAAS